MKIFYFSEQYSTHDHRFLTSLSKTSNQIYYLTLENGSFTFDKRKIPEKVIKINLYQKKKIINFLDYIFLWYQLKKIIKIIKPDIIHCGPIQTVGFLVALTNFQNIFSMSWGYDLLINAEKNLINKLITRFVLFRSKKFFCDCETVSKKAKKFGYGNKELIVFPWGINLNQFFPEKSDNIRKNLNWENKFVLLSLRSWEPIYGIDIVLKGFYLAYKKNKNLRLFLLGNGSMFDYITSFISTYNLQKVIKIPGRINQIELPSYYQNSDIYVSASHTDGSSVSLMEAMASGLPVIVSDIPGNIEWISEGKEGFFFPESNYYILATKILEMNNNKEKLIEMSKNSRKKAELKANWNINSKILLKAYENL